ncbi:MAG: ATP-binding protein [Chloroflexales bacterium]
MRHRITQLLAPPVFPDDEEATRVARVLSILFVAELLIIVIGVLGTLVVFENKLGAGILLGFLLGRLLLARALMWRGQIRQASIVWIMGIWLAATLIVLLSGRFGTTFVSFHLVIPVMIGILVGTRPAILVATLNGLLLLGVASAEMTGYPLPRYFPAPPLTQWFVLVMASVFTIIPLHVIIQELVAALARAHASEQRYAAMFDTAPVMYVIFRDPDGVPLITACNAAFLNTLGYRREQVVGHALAEFYTPASQAMLREEQTQQQWRTDSLVSSERDLVAADGRVFQNLLQVAPERDPTGQVIGVLAMYLDITARKQAEAELRAERALLVQRVEARTADLNRANVELVRAARAKDEFLSTMSHELRTPLNTILGFSGSLIDQGHGPLNAHQQTLLGKIEASGQHLLMLISDILDFTRAESGHLKLYHEDVLLTEVCESSFLSVKAQARAKQIHLALELSDQQCVLQADPKRLKQILVNLLSNAVKFTPSEGRVRLAAHGDPETRTARFSVEDTGIGIAPADLPRLFQPFVQLDARLSRAYEGTGLGLALTRRLVELHGGSLTVESTLGQGSRFTVSLPYA